MYEWQLSHQEKICVLFAEKDVLEVLYSAEAGDTLSISVLFKVLHS